MQRAKKTFVLYGAAVATFGLVLLWWLVFFAQQGDRLVREVGDSGIELSEAQSEAVRSAADESLRMFAFEGAFLAVLALLGFLLILRSMRREVEFYRRQREFLSGITHELRSPIASARLQVESLSLGRVPDEKRDRYLQHTLEDLDRLNRTVDQLLTAARASSGRVQLALEPIDLGEFSRGVVDRVDKTAGPSAVIELNVEDEVGVQADSTALDTIVENLLSNAIKYGGDPPRVKVVVKKEGGQGLLCVRDHGEGMSSKENGNLFDAFVRGREELVKRRPGVGLGLYLVSEMTRALEGTVSAANAAGGGLEVRVALPLAAGEVQ